MRGEGSPRISFSLLILYGELSTARLSEECPVNLNCLLFSTANCGSHMRCVWDAMEIYVNHSCLKDGKPDIEKIQPIVYSQHTYFAVGKRVDRAFIAGRQYTEKSEH